MEEKYHDRKDEPERGQTSNKQREKRSSKFNLSTDRDKANISVSQMLRFLGTPHRIRRQKRHILNLRKHFFSHALRDEK